MRACLFIERIPGSGEELPGQGACRLKSPKFFGPGFPYVLTPQMIRLMIQTLSMAARPMTRVPRVWVL